MAEFIANDKPLVVNYRGNIIFPIFSGIVTEDQFGGDEGLIVQYNDPCLLYTSPSPRDATLSRMPSSA